MSQTKKGFTLIEILVVILVSTLILTLVGGTMVFITTTTDDLIQQSEEIEMAKNIEKYVRVLAKEMNDLNDENLILYDGNIEYNGQTIFSDTGLSSLNIEQENSFVKCYLVFHSGRTFQFIIGIV